MTSRGTGISAQGGTPPVRGGALDALRFAAALLIVVYHYGVEAPTPLTDLHPVFSRGFLATDFFLMLSGYVLGRAYGAAILETTLGPVSFLARRLRRLWPAHIIVLAMFAVLILLAQAAGKAPHHADEFQWSALPLQAALAHAWGIPGGGGWNLPTWSLSALLGCYATFPFLWRRLGRFSRAGLLVAGAFGGVVLADLLTRSLLGHALSDMSFQWGVLRALPLFVLGAGLARATELAWPPERWSLSIALMAATVLVMLQAAGRFDMASLACIAALIVALGGRTIRNPSAMVARAAAVSFALFLTHILTATVYFNALRLVEAKVAFAEPVRWALWAAALPLAVFVAALFDRFVDQPVQRRLSTWVRLRPVPRPAPAQSA